jgi:hypothetical protein
MMAAAEIDGTVAEHEVLARGARIRARLERELESARPLMAMRIRERLKTSDLFLGRFFSHLDPEAR